VLLKVLELKFRYLLTTCQQTQSQLPSVVDGKEQEDVFRCRVCSQPSSQHCLSCLRNIVSIATSTHQKINGDSDFVKQIPNLDKDPRLDLSLIVAMCVLKLAGLNGSSPLREVNPTNLLQAVLVLDTQITQTPNDTPLRLLLVQLYLLLGCASYAYQLWVPMDVKRTVQDALSPLFFDRISGLSPGLFQGSRALMEPLRTYYTSTLRSPAPTRIWDAFSSGSYSSILGITEYDNRLRRSCTLVMSVVEERRATRAHGGKLEADITDLPLVGKWKCSPRLETPCTNKTCKPTSTTILNW
jgi:hypothetical protein